MSVLVLQVLCCFLNRRLVYPDTMVISTSLSVKALSFCDTRILKKSFAVVVSIRDEYLFD